MHGYEQWGTRTPPRLRGMFAFALRDREGRTVLARDRLGIKPLYFAHRPELGLLLFASEVHAILSSNLVSQAPDMDAVAAFLLFGSVPAPMTVNEGIRSLLPGHYAVLHRQRFTTTRYWDIGEIGGDSQERRVPRSRAGRGGAAHGERRAARRVSVRWHRLESVVVADGGAGGTAQSTPSRSGSRIRRSTNRAGRASVAHFYGTEHHEEVLAPHTLLDILPQVAHSSTNRSRMRRSSRPT